MSADGYVQITPDGGGKYIDNAVIQRGANQIFRQRVENYVGEAITLDASRRTRVSQLTTLYDGKILNADDANIWDSKGDGASTFADSSVSMSVAANQYVIRQGRFFTPYFSGKSHQVEITFDDFAHDAGVTKRFGYFSSSAVAPYSATLDGFFVESDGSSYALKMYNAGTETLNLDWTQWDGYADLAAVNFANFTVASFDFLWLGGAVLRLFFKVGGGFVLAHTFNFAGSAPGIFMRSPNHPVRYEIRSTGGVGSFKAICSQVSSEGSLSEPVQGTALITAAPIACGVIGTAYALKGVRSLAAYRDQSARVVKFGAAVISNQLDGGVLMLLLNPTLSAPLAWADSGRVSEGTANGTQRVTANGLIIDAMLVVNSGLSQYLAINALAQLAVGIDNSMGELILAYAPYTATQSVAGMMTLVRY